MVERLMQESQGMTIVVPDIRQPGEDRKRPDASKYLSGIRETLMGRQQSPDDREASIFHANVLIWNDVLEKDSAIRQLLDTICRTHSEIPFDYAWRAIMEREKQGATFIGEEIAIPHARLEGIDSTVLAVGVNKLGIYDPDSNNTATIMFLMLSPVSRPDSHVKLLGTLSKMTRDSQWRAEMRKAGSEMEVMQILRHWVEGNIKR
jgi:two-component system sensor histidine kinase KdpD